MCAIAITGPGAVNFILEHAEVDYVFVQHNKLKEVSYSCFSTSVLRYYNSQSLLAHYNALSLYVVTEF